MKYISFALISIFILSSCNNEEVSDKQSEQPIIDETVTSGPADETSMPAEGVEPDTMTERVVSTGFFDSVEAETSGEVIISGMNDSFELQMNNFSTGEAPDLFVYISENDIRSDVDIADAVEVAALENRQGNQSYILPSNFDVDEIAVVAIYCKEFDELYGVARLNPENTQVIEENNSGDQYVGLGMQEAINLAGENGDIFRVVSIDGEALAVTMDFVPGRINASVEEDIVVSYTIEG